MPEAKKINPGQSRGWFYKTNLGLLHPYKTTIQNRLMLPRKVGIAPIFEFLYLVRNQHFDSLAQFFLKEPRVKTHPRENVLCITKHLHIKKW
ncbi:MAG: hypothetical protein KIT62_03970 [Cyclobacteriaceae bacterium]|nr:hypothetical protein [Cyclobacteriaceae bacterium]